MLKLTVYHSTVRPGQPHGTNVNIRALEECGSIRLGVISMWFICGSLGTSYLPRFVPHVPYHKHSSFSRSPTKRDRTYRADVKEANSHLTLLLMCLCTDLTTFIYPTFTATSNYSKHGPQECGA